MPVTPREDTSNEGVKTRAQRSAEASSTPTEPDMPPTPAVAAEDSASVASTETASVAAPAVTSVSTKGVTGNQDMAMLIAIMNGMRIEQQHAREEQQRAREEQQRAREEQQRSQVKLQQLCEEQQRAREEQQRAREEQQRAREEQQSSLQLLQRGQEQLLDAVSNVKGEVAQLRKDVDMVEERVSSVENELVGVQKDIVHLKTRGVGAAGNVIIQGPRVKVPPYDGTTSWAAYRHQFRTVAAANGWSDEQCLTALTVALRGQALSVIEALPNENSGFKELIDALESRYGDRHLEHVYRAQLRDRTQRAGEGLQQWALEIEKLVRKAYPSSDSKTDGPNKSGKR